MIITCPKGDYSTEIGYWHSTSLRVSIRQTIMTHARKAHKNMNVAERSKMADEVADRILSKTGRNAIKNVIG